VELAELDAEIEQRLQAHPHATVLLSMPGMGIVLASEFLAATDGDVTVFETSNRLAAVSGLAPSPRDSGRISGNLRRPSATATGSRPASLIARRARSPLAAFRGFLRGLRWGQALICDEHGVLRDVHRWTK
jgi:transposase